jgi:ankyrin repeat protein
MDILCSSNNPIIEIGWVYLRLLQPLLTFMSWVQILNAEYSSDWNFYPQHATPLYYAASFGLTEMVKRLIETRINLNAPGSRFGGTALHAAVIRNHIDVMKLLLGADAKPSQADFHLITPLHTAAAHGNVDAAAMLLEFGASKDAVDETEETPYDWAVEAGQVDCQHLLLGLPVERKETLKSKKW